MRFTVVQRSDSEDPVHKLLITTQGTLMTNMNLTIIKNVRCFPTNRHEPCAIPGETNHEHTIYL